jgi:hypothetical protein
MEMHMTKTEEIFEAVYSEMTFSALQDASTIFKRVKDAGASLDEFFELVDARKNTASLIFAETRKKAIAMETLLRATARRCPLCGAIMNLNEVNNTKATQVGGDWKCLWECPDMMGCGFEEYSALPIKEEAAKFNMEFFFDPAARKATVTEVERRRRKAFNNRRRR